MLVAACLSLIAFGGATQDVDSLVAPNDESRYFAVSASFCWKDTIGRGVGKPISTCGAGYEKKGALCYKKCRSGWKRWALTECRTVCPSHMRDDGEYCRLAEYGRGTGYPLHFGEWSLSGAKRRCERQHGRCEKYGQMYYPKCKSGYHNAGCCICRPNRPNCGALGLGHQVDLSCWKKREIDGGIPLSCAPGQQYDAGLCYKRCSKEYHGVGPVCWSKPPAGWVDCGMGAAKSSTECAKIMVDQIEAVGNIALFIGTLGTSSGVTVAAKVGKGLSRVKKLKKAFKVMKKKWDLIKNKKWVKKASKKLEKAEEIGGPVWDTFDAASNIAPDMTEEDMVRISASIAAIVDPTGVAGAVAAYTYPKCSKVFGKVGSANWKSSQSISTTDDFDLETAPRASDEQLSTGLYPNAGRVSGSDSKTAVSRLFEELQLSILDA